MRFFFLRIVEIFANSETFVKNGLKCPPNQSTIETR